MGNCRKEPKHVKCKVVMEKEREDEWKEGRKEGIKQGKRHGHVLKAYKGGR